MEFKPSLWKVILSLVIGWIATPYLFGFVVGLTATNNAEISKNGAITIAVIGIVLVYTIWSLIEKKK